jgi:hypothetical protein
VSKIVSIISRSDQAASGVEVGLDQLVEDDVAGTGVVDVRGDGRRTRGGPERTGHPAGVLRGADGVSGGPGEPRGLVVELVGQVGHAVVGERDRGRVEGVGLDDVRAGLEVLLVDLPDDVRLGEREQVVVADEVGGPVGETLPAVAGLVGTVSLDRGPHRSVEHHDPLAQDRGEGCGRVRSVLDRHGDRGPLVRGQPRNHVRGVDPVPTS